MAETLTTDGTWQEIDARRNRRTVVRRTLAVNRSRVTGRIPRPSGHPGAADPVVRPSSSLSSGTRRDPLAEQVIRASRRAHRRRRLLRGLRRGPHRAGARGRCAHPRRPGRHPHLAARAAASPTWPASSPRAHHGSSKGFWIQDPDPDADPATSEGVFVFTSSAPTVAAGDAVTVAGTVSEYYPGGDARAATSRSPRSPGRRSRSSPAATRCRPPSVLDARAVPDAYAPAGDAAAAIDQRPAAAAREVRPGPLRVPRGHARRVAYARVVGADRPVRASCGSR